MLNHHNKTGRKPNDKKHIVQHKIVNNQVIVFFFVFGGIITYSIPGTNIWSDFLEYHLLSLVVTPIDPYGPRRVLYLKYSFIPLAFKMLDYIISEKCMYILLSLKSLKTKSKRRSAKWRGVKVPRAPGDVVTQLGRTGAAICTEWLLSCWGRGSMVWTPLRVQRL